MGLEITFLSSVAIVCAFGLLTAGFIAGTYVEQAVWAMPDRVNFRQCLPWFEMFIGLTMYFTSGFELNRNMPQKAFSVFTSIILINIAMMALPFFEVLYYVQVTTLLVIVALECLFMGLWLLIFHRLWKRFVHPKIAVLICGELARGNELAKKINKCNFSIHIDEVELYNNVDYSQEFRQYEAVVLINPPDGIKNDIAFICWEKQRELFIVPEVYELIINNAKMVQFDDLIVYRSKPIGLTAQQRLLKRTFDIISSLLALILLSPLYVIVACIVKKDGGPVIFSQKRVTQGGREFKLYKFRTMIPDAEKYTGPTLAIKDDPRITKAGKWLRQTRLDEIPQFWNTLIGDMSLVGPRPEREYFINLYKESIPEYQYRTNVRAGITGLAHVIGKYNTTPEERIKLDLSYMQNYSFFLDLKILIETMRVVLTKEYAEGVEKTDVKDEKELARH